MIRKLVFVLAASLLLGGCAASVKRAPAQAVTAPAYSATQQLSAVSLAYTEQGKQKAANNLKFNGDKLLDQVKRALATQSLLNTGVDQSLPTLEIQVKDMRIRGTFTAVFWGVMAGADSVSGDVVVRDAGGKEIDRFEVSASYALGGFAGGQDDARMSWLYENFAKQTLKELTRGNKTAKAPAVGQN